MKEHSKRISHPPYEYCLDRMPDAQRWEVRQTMRTKLRICKTGSPLSSGAVAYVPLRDGRENIARENSSIIAAAPQMLEALRAVKSWEFFDSLPADIWALVRLAVDVADATPRTTEDRQCPA